MTILVEPHSQKQEDAIFSDAKITALITGIQFGKSTAGALWIKRFIHTFTDPTDNFIITAPTFKIMSQATLPAFNQFMDGFGEHDKKHDCFKVHSGGTVWFRTSTDPDSVVGITNVRAIWGDEAGKYSKYFWDNLQARASFRDCPLILTSSPYSLNWIYKEFIKAKPAHVRFITARSNENPYFPQTEWERRKAHMDPRRFAAIYGGEFERMQGLVYDCFHEELHVIEPFALPPGTVYYAGIDWGFTDPFVLHIRAITPSGQHYVVGEFSRAMMTITDIVTLCKQQKEIFGIKTFYCDPSQPAAILELNRNGCPAVGATNDIRYGIDMQYEMIRSGRFKVFTKAAPYLLDEIESYHYPEPKELGVDEKGKDMLPVGQNDHCLTADTAVWTPTGLTSMEYLASMKDGLILSQDDDGSIVIKRFTNARCTGIKKVLCVTLESGSSFECSENHIVLGVLGWQRAETLRVGDKILRVEQSSLMALNSLGIRKPDTISQDASRLGSIVTSGKSSMEKFQKAITCITRTIIKTTIASKILNFFMKAITYRDILARKKTSNVRESISSESCRLPVFGTKVRLEELGTALMLAKSRITKSQEMRFANSVVKSTKASSQEDSVPITANQLRGEFRELITFKGNVAYAYKTLVRTNTREIKHAQKIVRIDSLGEQRVYNLEVEYTHNYIDEHGVVHHNCMDAMRYCSVMTLNAHSHRAPTVPSGERKKSDNPFENVIKRKNRQAEAWS